MALFGRILGSGKRTHHRWTSGHLELGQRRKREAQIAEQLTAFKQQMDRQGVKFRTDRDAWEAYWQKNPRAHMELVGASVDEVLGEKAFQVFQGFWQRINKVAIVRFEGDGEVTMPTLLTLGEGETRARSNPLEALMLTDPEARALEVVRIDQTIQRYEKSVARYERNIGKLEKIRAGLESGATGTVDPDTGVMIVQGLIMEPMEDGDGEDETAG